jgi:hypothetical protein
MSRIEAVNPFNYSQQLVATRQASQPVGSPKVNENSQNINFGESVGLRQNQFQTVNGSGDAYLFSQKVDKNVNPASTQPVNFTGAVGESRPSDNFFKTLPPEGTYGVTNNIPDMVVRNNRDQLTTVNTIAIA